MTQSATMPSVPNAPRTPIRSFRIPDDVYREAQEHAGEAGETVTDVVNRALEKYNRAARKKRANG